MKKKLIILCVLEFVFIIVLTAVLAFLLMNRKKLQTEIDVRTPENISSREDAAALAALAKKHGVSVINICVKQDEDDEVPSGEVFYRSSVAPVAEGYENFDALEAVILAAHEEGIKVRAWIPQFHDAAAAEEHPSWRMMTVSGGESVPYASGDDIFISPLCSSACEYEESIIKEVAENYDVDGIVLDWIRFDGFAMDLSREVRSDYEEQKGCDPAAADFGSGDDERADEWNEWREKKLGSYIVRVREMLRRVNPDIELGAYILPPEFIECGQNIGYFSSALDFVSPMAYFSDWGFDSDWVTSADSGVIFDTCSLADDAGVIPALNLPEGEAAVREDRKIRGELKKNYPDIKSVDYFVYGKWNEELMSNL